MRHTLKLKKADLQGLPEGYIHKHNEFFYISDNKDDAPIKIGTKVMKVNSEKRDTMVNGALGKVIGSISNPVEMPEGVEYLYTIIWDQLPERAVSIIGKKLTPLL